MTTVTEPEQFSDVLLSPDEWLPALAMAKEGIKQKPGLMKSSEGYMDMIYTACRDTASASVNSSAKSKARP
jgi:hypothetical protein